MGCNFSANPLPVTTDVMKDVGTGLVDKIHDAMCNGPLESCLPMLTEDVVVTMGNGTTYKGKDGFISFLRIYKEAFPDVTITNRRDVVSSDESVVASECTMTGTHEGNLNLGGPGVTYPRTGKSISSSFVEIYEFTSGGHLRALSHHQDMTAVLTQLGLFPPPSQGTAVSGGGMNAESNPTSIRLGEVLPNFEVETTQGKFRLYDYFGDSWGMLFSHPADFTPICTTELSTVAKYKPEFDKRNVKLIALSCDPVESHNAWTKDIGAYDPNVIPADTGLPYPIIADENREVASRLGMLEADKPNGQRPSTVRAVYIISPDKKVRLSFLYPSTTGRNFDEIVRAVDAVQLSYENKVATPANWTPGQECIVSSSLTTDEATKMFPAGVRVVDLPSTKDYLRFTPDPRRTVAEGRKE